MKKLLFCILALLLCQTAFAEIPTSESQILSVNLKAEKIISGFYAKFDKFPEMKGVLEDFDQIFQENAGINPRKDFSNFGLLLLARENSFQLVGYIDGNFNPAKVFAEIEAAAQFIPPIAQKKIEIRQIGDQQTLLITDEKKNRTLSAWFYSSNLLLISQTSTIEQLVKKPESIKKLAANQQRPGLGKELSVWVDTLKARTIFEKNPNPALIPVIGLLGMFNNLELTIDRNDINMAFSCVDETTAQNLKTFIDGQLAGYRMFIDSQLKNLSKPQKDPNWLPMAFKYLMGKSVALMSKKSLEQTKVIYKNSEVFLSSAMPPLTDSLLNPFTIGATGVLAAIAIPNFQKARVKAQKKACFAQQRVILGGIEMYNMDNANGIRTLNHEAIENLIKGKYVMPSSTQCPSGGNYFSEGDMTKDGIVKCTVHGEVK